MGRAGQPEAVGVLEGGGQLQVLGGPSEMRPGWWKTLPSKSLFAGSPILHPPGLGLLTAPSPVVISVSCSTLL